MSVPAYSPRTHERMSGEAVQRSQLAGPQSAALRALGFNAVPRFCRSSPSHRQIGRSKTKAQSRSRTFHLSMGAVICTGLWRRRTSSSATATSGWCSKPLAT